MIQLVVSQGFPTWAAWALTVFLHAALWYAGGWLLCGPWPGRGRSDRAERAGAGLNARTRNLIWRVVLVAPLLSATWPGAAGAPWRLAPFATAPAADLPIDVSTARDWQAETRGSPLPTSPPPGSENRTPLPLGEILFGLLAAVALVRLVRLGGATARFRLQLSARLPVGGQARRLLDRLCAAAGRNAPVQLSRSAFIDCPLALGSHEVCLPSHPLSGLDDRMLEAVLAHELAHLERRDNAWLTAAGLLEAVLFFQPFTHLTRRRLQESAEQAADDRAVELTADPLGLARSLAEVASWQTTRPPQWLAHAMAAPKAGLVQRVERLLARPASTPRSRATTAAALVGLIAVGLIAPALVPPAAATPPAATPAVVAAPAAVATPAVVAAPAAVATVARVARVRRSAAASPRRVIAPIRAAVPARVVAPRQPRRLSMQQADELQERAQEERQRAEEQKRERAEQQRERDEQLKEQAEQRQEQAEQRQEQAHVQKQQAEERKRERAEQQREQSEELKSRRDALEQVRRQQQTQQTIEKQAAEQARKHQELAREAASEQRRAEIDQLRRNAELVREQDRQQRQALELVKRDLARVRVEETKARRAAADDLRRASGEIRRRTREEARDGAEPAVPPTPRRRPPSPPLPPAPPSGAIPPAPPAPPPAAVPPMPPAPASTVAPLPPAPPLPPAAPAPAPPAAFPPAPPPAAPPAASRPRIQSWVPLSRPAPPAPTKQGLPSAPKAP